MALTVALGLPAGARGDTQGPAIDLAARPGALRDVPDAYRPSFRWWWPRCGLSHDDLATGLRAMRDAGFGGAEQVLMGGNVQGDPSERGGYAGTTATQFALDSNCWFTPSFRELTRTALETAGDLGMKLDITMGPGWPPSSPATKGDLAVQGLAYGQADVAGGTAYTGPVPRAAPGSPAGISTPSAGVQSGADDKLVAVTAVKLLDPAAAAKPVMLDPKSAVDLTATVSGGQVSWTAPEPGTRWKLLGFWQRANGGGIPDHFSLAATRALLADYDQRLFGGDMAPLLRGAGNDVFEDSPEYGVGQNIFWTPDFIAQTTRRRGYDPTRYLPALFIAGQNAGLNGSAAGPADFDFPDHLGDRLRHDYYETLTDLYIDRHITPVRAWARGHGLRSRIQPAYGVTLGVVRSAVASERADQETLYANDPGPVYGDAAGRQALDLYREVSSGPHLSGSSSIVGSELGARLIADHELTATDYKAWADRSFAGGITRVLVHGFNVPDLANVPWPGFHAFAGLFAEDWSPDSPMLRGIHGLAGYWGRAAVALQNGRPRLDLAVYRDDIYTYTDRTQVALDGKALSERGFTWDLIDPGTLRERGEVRGGRLMPDGAAYKGLVISTGAHGPAARGALPAGVAEHVLGLARRGLPVVFLGDLPARGTSFDDAVGEDARLKAALAALLKLPNVRRAPKEADLPDALDALHVAPDMRPATNATVLPVHRVSEAGDVWFVFNDSAKAVDTTVRFATRGYPTEIDLWDGTATPVAEYGRDRGTVSLPLRLAPGETRLLAFGPQPRSALHVTASDAERTRVAGDRLLVEDSRPGTRTTTLSDGRKLALTVSSLPAPIKPARWDLAVTEVGPGGPVEHKLTLDSLQDWRSIPEIASVSGTGVYTTHLDVPAAWLASDRGVRLNVGKSGGALEVFLNGKRVTWQDTPDVDVPVDDLLHAGDNELRVVVTTNRINKMVALAHSDPDPYYRLWSARSTQAYGLLGPVELRPLGRASVALPPLRRRCASRRRVGVTVRVPAGFRTRRGVMRIGRKTRRVSVRVRGRRARAVIDLRGRPPGTVRVRLTLRDGRGRVRRTVRTYQLCGRH